MFNLSGKAVSSTLMEIYGPSRKRNYSDGDPSKVQIRVIGTGGVRLQVNTSYIIAGSVYGALNQSGQAQLPDPSTWTNVGDEITAVSGVTTLNITPTGDIQFLRLIISTAGSGKVHFTSLWNGVGSGANDGPTSKFVPVTKHDTNNLPQGACRALLVGVSGTANITEEDGTERTDVPLQTGYNPIRCIRIKTGGTADNIWALY